MYLLRCAPCYDHLRLIDYDKLLRGGMERILNISLTEDQWIQASLPIRMGKLGVRRVSSLAQLAFWLRLWAPSPSSLSSWDQPGMVRTHPLIAHKQTGFESQELRTRKPAPVTSSHCGTSRFCSRLCRLSERDYTTPTIGHALMPPWLRTPPTGYTPFHSPRSTSN